MYATVLWKGLVTILSASSAPPSFGKDWGPTSLLSQSVRGVYCPDDPLPLNPPRRPPLPPPPPRRVWRLIRASTSGLRQVGDAAVSVVRSSTSQGPLVVSTQPLTRIQDCRRRFSRQQLAVDVFPLESCQRYRYDSRAWLMSAL